MALITSTLCSGLSASVLAFRVFRKNAIFATEFPEKSILVIDADTIADPTHPAFNCIAEPEKLDRLLRSADIILSSPAIETGLSFEQRQLFAANFTLAWGQQAVNAVRQAMMRVRDNTVPRYLWVPRVATIGRLGRNAKTKAKYFKAIEKKKTFVAIDMLKKSG